MNWVDEFKCLIKCAKGTKTVLIAKANIAKQAGYLNETELTEVVGLINSSELAE